MKKITGEEFRIILSNVERDYFTSDYIVDVENNLEIVLDINFLNTYFKNITFTGEKIIFITKNQEPINVEFDNCTFICNVNFDNCKIDILNFSSNIIKSNFFLFDECKINNLSFKVDNIFEDGKLKLKKINNFENVSFQILNCEFAYFDLEEINFNLSNINIKDTTFNCSTSIVRCLINKLIFSHCFFKKHFDYFGNKSNPNYTSSFFNHCEFNYSSFFETTFNFETNFANCNFLNITKFEEIRDDIRTTLKFEDCDFLNHVSFNKSRIHKLLFDNVSFKNIVSFQETYYDIVDISRTIFEKQAYFDDIQIKQIDECNRTTIRAIKQQLQKAENKIDYNRFRIFEFNAYRKEIQKKLLEFKKDKNKFYHRLREPIQLKRDLFILNLTECVSEYGTDWKRAFKFTFWSGFLIYLLFYICENYNHTIETSNWGNWTILISGFFRFFLVTDFYNPLVDDRVYLTNPLSWIIFIFGKIVIAFGIYEMIQSFRKFKA